MTTTTAATTTAATTTTTTNAEELVCRACQQARYAGHLADRYRSALGSYLDFLHLQDVSIEAQRRADEATSWLFTSGPRSWRAAAAARESLRRSSAVLELVQEWFPRD